MGSNGFIGRTYESDPKKLRICLIFKSFVYKIELEEVLFGRTSQEPLASQRGACSRSHKSKPDAAASRVECSEESDTEITCLLPFGL